MTRIHIWTIALLATACGGGGGGGGNSDASGAPDGAGPDGAQGALVPDPGTVVGGEWTDVEPNDTPDRATPVGILNGPVWAGFVEPYTEIDSATDVDWYVFKTADAASLPNDYIAMCWGAPVNLLDLYLYEVVDQRQGPQVRAAESTDASCETIVGFGEGPTILAADTTYLLEVRATAAAGGATLPAMYGA